MDAIAFGALVRRRRIEAGVTQRELAMGTNTGPRFVLELEAGKPTCQLGKALAVARALGIDLVDQRAIVVLRQHLPDESSKSDDDVS